MAALPAKELPEGPDWLYEVKWDGYRALLIKDGVAIRLWSRNQKDLSRTFPSIIEQGNSLKAGTAVVDGEVVAIGDDGKPCFQALQHRSSRIEFFAFDLLHLNGEDLRELPLEERRTRLEGLVRKTGLRLSQELDGEAAEVVAAVKKLGLEGVVAKRRDSRYRPGERNGDWRKLRLNNEQEFVIGGYRPGLIPFESILVGYYEKGEFLFASKVRPGLTPQTRRAIWDLIKNDGMTECPFKNLPDAEKKGRWGEGITAEEMKELRWVKPRHVVQISFVEWTRGGHLRHLTQVRQSLKSMA
jgi:bifunctional non-homologous end joining protein LigD